MHADAHFVIGQAHVTGGKPCQDYALAGDLPGGGAYAIASDGCSSGGKTDVGARILALGTAVALREPWSPGSNSRRHPAEVGVQQRAVLAGAGALLGCQSDDLLATCIYAVASDTDLFAFIQGDGVVAWRSEDGRVMMTRFDWDDNAPYYPAYAHGQNDQFVAFHGGDYAAERLSSVTWTRFPDGHYELHSEYRYSVAEAMHGILWPLEVFSGTTQLAVFTDGVTQVNGVDWKDAVYQLMNFKSTTGEFAKRRLNRFVRDAHKLGRGPIDDLACAVVNLTP